MDKINHALSAMEGIDHALEEYIPIDTRSHIEEEVWSDLYTDWESGLLGNVSLDEVQKQYYKWFRLERGLPPEE